MSSPCRACRGTGRCARCHGTGLIGAMKLTCSDCTRDRDKCPNCRGRGAV